MSGRKAAAGLLLVALLVPARALDIGLLALLRLARGSLGPSPAITLFVADRPAPEDASQLVAAGAKLVTAGDLVPPPRGLFEGSVLRRAPDSGSFWAASYVDWRGGIDSGAFLSYDPDDLRAHRIPAAAISGRTILHGPRGTGQSELLATPAGALTALEYSANVMDGNPYVLFPLWLQAAMALVPLGFPRRPAWAIAAGALALASTAFLHVMPGLFASTAGFLLADRRRERPRADTLERLFSEGRHEELLALAGPGDEFHAARALVELKRVSEATETLARADLRSVPADGAARLASKLEDQGESATALALLEWAIVSGGPAPELSKRAAQLRSQQAGLKGLLGMEGIQRLISGRYTKLEFLGQGGMGIVLSGHDTFLDRPVAIKVLHPSLLSDASSRARFRREVETMMKLDHPNIVEIHAVHSDDLLYFTMELLDGRSVREALLAKLPVDRLAVLSAVAECMAHCHEQGILHRDLKSDNVFLRSDGRVKLIDFGVARALGGDELTAAGEMVGTLCYIAPEQFGGARADRQSDIFAFGVMAYEIYAGKVPFAHPLSMGNVIPPPGMPVQVGMAMLRCLAKDRGERYADFRQVLEGLREPEV